MRIAVRLDDIAPVMHWDNFERMMSLLRERGAWPLLGVIPDCRDEAILEGEGTTWIAPEEEESETIQSNDLRSQLRKQDHDGIENPSAPGAEASCAGAEDAGRGAAAPSMAEELPELTEGTDPDPSAAGPGTTEEPKTWERDYMERSTRVFARRMQALEEAGCVVAMHGVRHVYTTKEGGIFPLNRKSELAGLPLEAQEALLTEGVERMEILGLDTDIFMAPSHSYDEATLVALGRCGFRRVTDGFGSAPYRYRDLTFYPIAMDRSRAVASRRKGTVTIVFHVNGMTEEDFLRAEQLLDRAELIPYRQLLYEPTVRRPIPLQRLEGLLARTKRFLVGARSGGGTAK